MTARLPSPPPAVGRLAGLRPVLAVVAAALVVGACAVPATPLPSLAPSPTPPANPYDAAGVSAGSGSGLKIGYVSFGDQVPFVKAVSDGIAEQVATAGATLVPCDAGLEAGTVRKCIADLVAAGVQGLILFQLVVDPADACKAVPSTVPVIGVELDYPCQAAYVGADDFAGGETAGAAVGAYAKEQWSCTYDALVTLGSSSAPDRAQKRLEGFRRGFATSCEIHNEQHQQTADREDNAKTAMEGVLGSLPAATRLVVTGINDDGILGALAAAKAAGRETSVFVTGQGGEVRVRDLVRADGQYLGDAAYRPERYGRTIVPALLDAIAGKTLAGPFMLAPVWLDATTIGTIYP